MSQATFNAFEQLVTKLCRDVAGTCRISQDAAAIVVAYAFSAPSLLTCPPRPGVDRKLITDPFEAKDAYIIGGGAQVPNKTFVIGNIRTHNCWRLMELDDGLRLVPRCEVIGRKLFHYFLDRRCSRLWVVDRCHDDKSNWAMGYIDLASGTQTAPVYVERMSGNRPKASEPKFAMFVHEPLYLYVTWQSAMAMTVTEVRLRTDGSLLATEPASQPWAENSREWIYDAQPTVLAYGSLRSDMVRLVEMSCSRAGLRTGVCSVIVDYAYAGPVSFVGSTAKQHLQDDSRRSGIVYHDHEADSIYRYTFGVIKSGRKRHRPDASRPMLERGHERAHGHGHEWQLLVTSEDGGHVRWRYSQQSTALWNVVYDSINQLFFVLDDPGMVHCICRRTSREMWHFQSHEWERYSGPQLLLDDVLYLAVRADSNKMTVKRVGIFDRLTGDLLQTNTLDESTKDGFREWRRIQTDDGREWTVATNSADHPHCKFLRVKQPLVTLDCGQPSATFLTKSLWLVVCSYIDRVEASAIIHYSTFEPLVAALASFNSGHVIDKRHLAENAAQVGNLELVQQLGQSHMRVVIAAVRGSHMGILEWLWQTHAVAPDSQYCINAAETGRLDILQWLIKRGCQPDARACASAASRGHKHILVWLRDNHCRWDMWTTRSALSAGFYELFQYALAAGCPCADEDKAVFAQRMATDSKRRIAKFVS